LNGESAIKGKTITKGSICAGADVQTAPSASTAAMVPPPALAIRLHLICSLEHAAPPTDP